MKHMHRILCTAIIFCLSSAAAQSEEGCPTNQFLSGISHRCVPVSKYDHVVGADEPMVFHARQISMQIIWISAEGVITKDTPAQFAKLLKSDDAKITNMIELHSPGGNLAAGLELGRMIRAAGYRTGIGRSISLSGYSMDVYQYKRAMCMSACAYAFLGGVARSFGFGSNDIYGLHRFGVDGAKIDSDAAQIVTSEIAKYLEEMGVDQRVLRIASSTDTKDMLPIPISIAEQLRIIFDPDKAYPFVVEELEGNITASTRFFFRNKFYEVRLNCLEKRFPNLTIFANSSAFPPAMIGLKSRKASFRANGETLFAVLNSESLANGHSYMAFLIPDLASKHFLGDGLILDQIDNPSLPPLPDRVDLDNKSQFEALYKRINWLDSIGAVSFRIRAQNADRTVPIVLKNCRP